MTLDKEVNMITIKFDDLALILNKHRISERKFSALYKDIESYTNKRVEEAYKAGYAAAEDDHAEATIKMVQDSLNKQL